MTNEPKRPDTSYRVESHYVDLAWLEGQSNWVHSILWSDFVEAMCEAEERAVAGERREAHIADCHLETRMKIDTANATLRAVRDRAVDMKMSLHEDSTVRSSKIGYNVAMASVRAVLAVLAGEDGTK